MGTHNDEGFNINDPIEVGDLSDQTGEEVLEPARRVGFVVKKATIRTQLQDNKQPEGEDNPWKVKRLALQIAVGPDGVDGEGKYAKKVLFPELPLTFNVQDFPEQFNTEYYQKRARNDTKMFFTAMGHNPKALPRITDEFLTELVGQEFVADITRKERRALNTETNEWEGTGEYQNLITNYRPASIAVSA